MPRPPQPIWTQLSLLPGPGAASRLGNGRRGAADNAPAVSAVRLRNERRFQAKVIIRSNCGPRHNARASCAVSQGRSGTQAGCWRHKVTWKIANMYYGVYWQLTNGP